jgi:DNA-binding response OmpR family regulator
MQQVDGWPTSDAGEGQRGLLQLGNLLLNFNTYEALIDGVSAELSYIEFELLLILVAERDKVLSYEGIARRLWKPPAEGSIRHLHVIVHRVRRKLAGLNPYEIRTVRGRGYGLVSVPRGEPAYEGG